MDARGKFYLALLAAVMCSFQHCLPDTHGKVLVLAFINFFVWGPTEE
jgi:hypothetical protein